MIFHRHSLVFSVVLTAAPFVSTGLAQAEPPQVVPPVTVSVDVPETSSAHWILPGPRALDPAVFGTPEQPLGFQNAPDVGVALDSRLTEGDNYTTTQEPTAHSNKSEVVSGSVSFTVTDMTAVDNPQSQDTVDFESTFSAPGDSGDSYRVVVQNLNC